MGNAQKDSQTEERYVDELAVGTKLGHGQFEIEKFLNSGGFGITYLAKDSLARQVVIKECFPSSFCHRAQALVEPRSSRHLRELSSVVDLFLQEAHSLSKLEHPNIVGVHQVFEENNTAYMVLDFVEGRDLLDTLEDENHGLTAPQIKGILKDVLSAIQYVHNQSMLHRDISPDNILLDSDLRPVLIDFGAAREEATKKSRVLSALRVVKDGYSPQEFYIQGSAQTPSSDLYALGATFYHLIAGEIPPNSQARLAAVATTKQDIYEPLVDRFKGYDTKLLSSIDKALCILPKDRLQSAQDWLDMLDSKRLKSRVVTATAPVSSAAAETILAEQKLKSKLVPFLGSAAILAIVAALGLVGTGTIDITGASEEAAAIAQEALAAELEAAEAIEAEALRLAEIEANEIELQLAAELAAAKAAQEAEIARLAEIAATEAAAESAAELAAAKSALEAETVRLAELARRAEIEAKEAAAARALELAEAKTAIEQETARAAEIVAREAAAAREAELAEAKAAQEAEITRLAEVAAAEAKIQRTTELAAAKAKQEAESTRLAKIAAAEAATQREMELAKLKEAQEAEIKQIAEIRRLAEISVAQDAQKRAAELAAAKEAQEAEVSRIAQAATAAQEAEIARVAQAATEVQEVETTRLAQIATVDTTGILSASSVKLPFKGLSDSNAITEVDAAAPAWAQKGTRILAVNGSSIETLADAPSQLRTFGQPSENTMETVSFLLQREGSNRTTEMDWAFPATQEITLSNGLGFVSQYDGEAWRTIVTDVPAGSNKFKVGDQLVALVSTSEVIEGRTTLEEILKRELANGQDRFSFAVTRGGSLWVVHLIYSGDA